MVSKQQIPVAGHQLTVYGLDEYKALGIEKPVAIMFGLHGRLQDMSKMEDISQTLCELNGSGRQTSDRHLIVITFDHPNHGSRLLHKLGNFAWKEGRHQNPFHAQDMWSMFAESGRTVSALIDVVEDYLFGPTQTSRVQVWGVMGFSMGGHAAFMAAANDPRITVAIPIVGTADFLSLMSARVDESSLSKTQYLPQAFCKMVEQKVASLDTQLSNTKILMINGEKDNIVPGRFNYAFVERLKKVHQGEKGQDWDFVVVKDVGHAWCPAMVDLSRKWCEKWMIQTAPKAHL